MKNISIKNIIFDLGGVIIDIAPNQVPIELKRAGFNDLEKLEEPAFVKLLDDFERGIYTADTFRKKVRQYLDLRFSDQKFDDIWNSLLLDIPAIRINTLEQVHQHYNIFLLSNSNEIHYDLYVRDLQLRFGYHQFDDLFDKSYFSFDIHLAKPHSDIFEYVLDQHALKPEETLFIDDTLDNILTAKSLGVHTHHMQAGEVIRNFFDNGILKDGVIDQ